MAQMVKREVPDGFEGCFYKPHVGQKATAGHDAQPLQRPGSEGGGVGEFVFSLLGRRVGEKRSTSLLMN